MTIRQVNVPYLPGYDLGVSADLATGSPMGKAVDGAASTMQDARGATVTFAVKRVQSTEDLEQALGIEAEASYGSGAFGPSISARFSFAKKSKIQSSSLFMIVTAEVQLAFESIDDPVLTADADNMLDRPDVFGLRYGNVFVRGVQRGGLFIGTIRVETNSADQSSSIEAELKGSYGFFSADAKLKFSEVQQKYSSSVYVDMYHEGGPVDLTITDVTDPKELLDNANKFMNSFAAQTQEAVAKPYFVTLAPVAIARSVHPPLNLADVEHAQDVLVACTKARSRILDKLNLLEFILANTGKFTLQPGVDAAALTAVQTNFENDLDIVAQCATAAIDSPADAKMPPDFAAGKGKTYPSGILPTAMPLPVAGKTATVPDIVNCSSWQDCNDAITRAGLIAQQTIASNITPSVFKVLSVSPPAAQNVPEGSVVTVTTQPAKVEARSPFFLRTGSPVFRLAGGAPKPSS